MNHKQLRAAITKLGLQPGQAARLVHCPARTFRRYLAAPGTVGARKVPEAIAIIFQLMLAGRLLAADLEALKP